MGNRHLRPGLMHQVDRQGPRYDLKGDWGHASTWKWKSLIWKGRLRLSYQAQHVGLLSASPWCKTHVAQSRDSWSVLAALWYSDRLLPGSAPRKSPLVYYTWVCKVKSRDLSDSFSVTAYFLHSSYVQYVLHLPAMSRVSVYSLPWSFRKWPVAGLKLSQWRDLCWESSLVSGLVSPRASGPSSIASCSANTAVNPHRQFHPYI